MGDQGKSATRADSHAAEESPDQPECKDVQSPQNVDISATVAQMMATLQQINGRTPGLEPKHATEGTMKIMSAAGNTTELVAAQSAVPVVVGRISNAMQSASISQNSGVDEQAAFTTQITGASETGESFRTVQEPTIQQNAAVCAPVQRQSVLVSETLKPVLKPAVNNTATMDALVQQHSQNGVQEISGNSVLNNSPDPAIQQNAAVNESVQRATLPHATQTAVNVTASKVDAGQEPVRNVLPERQATVVNVVSAPPESEQKNMSESLNTAADSLANQAAPTTAKSVLRPALEAYFQASVAPSGNGVADTALTRQEMNPPTMVDAVVQGSHPFLSGHVAVDGKRSNHQAGQEVKSSQPDTEDTFNGVESRSGNVIAVAVKQAMASMGGESSSQDGNGPADQKSGVQDFVIPLHQLKTERTPLVSSASGVTVSETVRANVMEQVVNQVREHVAGRDIKNGAEQIVIRLSPENLGELKLNLRMENQCLRVEIVAENNMVRDTLIKHSDALKETLARQNITMEAFDVSTGSNKNGASPQGQGEWQELTRQQQHAAWNTSRGYRVSETPELLRTTLYQPSSEHSMVDVHF
jgi:flagellar hook-length control protein FliK